MAHRVGQNQPVLQTAHGLNNMNQARLRATLLAIKRTAAEYMLLTGKLLCVTDEIAQYVAGETLGLTLVSDRNGNYNALRGSERIQIIGRAYPCGTRLGCPKLGTCDTVILVVLDRKTLNAHEIWEAPCDSLRSCGTSLRSNPRARALPVYQFQKSARLVWQSDGPSFRYKSALQSTSKLAETPASHSTNEAMH